MTNEAAERLREFLRINERWMELGDLDDALAAERRATVERMEAEGVVTWGDDRHRQRFLDAEAER